MPDIPTQPDPWNNEYIVSAVTRYTENGTLRTGAYRRRLRTPLTVAGFGHPHQQVGILTDNAAAPHVTVTGGNLTAPTAQVRIQAVLNAQDGGLRFSLLDMSKGGAAGAEVRVTANGVYTFAGLCRFAAHQLGADGEQL